MRKGKRLMFKVLPNGNVRGYFEGGASDGCSELQFYNAAGVCGTLGTAHIPKVIIYADDNVCRGLHPRRTRAFR